MSPIPQTSFLVGTFFTVSYIKLGLENLIDILTTPIIMLEINGTLLKLVLNILKSLVNIDVYNPWSVDNLLP